MTDTNTNEEEVKAAPAPQKQAIQKVKVMSSKTWDSPTFNWGIHAGETRELPVDEALQKEVLSKEFITQVK